MNPEFAVELIKSMMMQAVAIAAPILLTVMVLGLAISLFQAVTSIHEQTLTFVPKALGVVALLVILLPWILRSLIEFARAVVEKIPQMVQ
ncbi:MAG: flagellar biosynthetic protein FliQ [Verrucomicrobia bacterium]|jgi:flagellar biosynthetic protein FliQ|nr:flagellar biosynthetic protein FliQ [Verrucomicrobiota bacterium]